MTCEYCTGKHGKHTDYCTSDRAAEHIAAMTADDRDRDMAREYLFDGWCDKDEPPADTVTELATLFAKVRAEGRVEALAAVRTEAATYESPMDCRAIFGAVDEAERVLSERSGR